MGHGYVAVQWTRRKLIYDAILLAAVSAYLVLFMAVSHGLASKANVPLETDGVAIRAYGSAAYILLHLTLSIGPLARFHPFFHTLLFNRRHMGVMVFLLGFVHVNGWRLPGEPWSWFGQKAPQLPWSFHGALNWYNDFGNREPLLSLFTGNRHFADVSLFPFELLGVVGLAVLFVMAATSHDFWLTNLTAPVWKSIHMAVYLGYAALVGHVLLGALQSNQSPWLAALVLAGLFWLLSIHVISGWREWVIDAHPLKSDASGWVDLGPIDAIPDGQGKVVALAGERIAVFRQGAEVYALSNVCQHQNGPLGEGRVVNGCVVCPWHGYEYRLETGASPPPFTECVPTFKVELHQGRVRIGLPPRPAKPA